MYGGIHFDGLVKEFFGDSSWRIMPEDALSADKFVAEMVFERLDDEMFPGSTVAHGYIFKDSRGIFLDGDKVRTSSIKQIVEIDGELYIETRNTMYKVINPEVIEHSKINA